MRITNPDEPCQVSLEQWNHYVALANYYVHDWQDAEDVVNSMFLQLLVWLRSGGQIDRPEHFFRTALRRKSVDTIRKRRRSVRETTNLEPGCLETILVFEDDRAEWVQREEDLAMLRAAINDLPRDLRTVIERRLHGMTINAIANEEKCCSRTIDKDIKAAKAQLRDAMSAGSTRPPRPPK